MRPNRIFRKLDVGDIVGIVGRLFRTKTGRTDPAVRQRAPAFQVLSVPCLKSTKALTNVELRYRQRYVDLIVNPKVRDIFRKRSKIVHEVRNFP